MAGGWLLIRARRPPGRPSLGSSTRAIVCCAVVIGGHVATDALTGVLSALPGPDGTGDQAAAMRIGSDLEFAAGALAAGAREEVPLLALVAAVMTAARRPNWQILAAVCVIRVIPHLYFGLPAIVVIVFAVFSLRVWQSSRRIGPIIAGRTICNAVTVFGGTPGHYALTMISAGGVVTACLLCQTLKAA